MIWSIQAQPELIVVAHIFKCPRLNDHTQEIYYTEIFVLLGVPLRFDQKKIFFFEVRCANI